MLTNPYATLKEFKSFLTSRGQNASVDAQDDANIELLLDGVSRYVDDQVYGRTFYPRYEKRWFDVPILQNSPRNLFLDDDLLEVVTITNGDGTVVLPAVYNLKPKNYSPHYAIQITGPSSIFWIFNGIGSVEKVISVEAWWGFHNRYEQRGWTQVGTLGAAITDTTTLPFVMTSGHSVLPNEIIKIDSEIMNVATIQALSIVSSTNASPIAITTNGAHGLTTGAQVVVDQHTVNTNANGTWTATVTGATTITLDGSVGNGVGGATGSISSSAILANTITPNQRGDNGSAAATHINGAAVYRWNVQPEIKSAVLSIAQNMYSQRSGQSSSGRVTITAAGVVIRPEDVPSMAQKTIDSFRRTI